MKTVRALLATTALAATWLALAPAEADAQRRQRDRLTRDEIMESAQRDHDLHAAIKALRPRFLEGTRGATTLGGSTAPAELIVVVDRKRIGGPESLQSILASDVQEVQWLTPAQAQDRYGAAGTGGALLITLHKVPANPPPSATPPPTSPPPTSPPPAQSA